MTMAKLDPNPIPSHAVTLWVDDLNIYALIPGPTPHVTRYPRSEGGLTKALNLLRTRYEEVPVASRNYTAPQAAPRLVNGKPPVQTETQRATALNVLKKLGIV